MRSECKKWTFELCAITNENSYRKEEKKEKKGKISFQTKPLDQSMEREFALKAVWPNAVQGCIYELPVMIAFENPL